MTGRAKKSGGVAGPVEHRGRKKGLAEIEARLATMEAEQ
jgi:hypothetical protein